MSAKKSNSRFQEFWDDFRREKSGLIGLGILAVAILVVIFEPLFLPYKDVNEGNWRNISYWEDNSSAAPPAWTNIFTSKKSAVSTTFDSPEVSTEEDPNYGPVTTYSFKYNYKYDLPPLDLIIRAKASGMSLFLMELERPDGNIVPIGEQFFEGLNEDQIRYSMDTDAASNAYEFARQFASEEALANSDSTTIRPTFVAFSETGSDMLSARVPLKGTYTLRIRVPSFITDDSNNVLEDLRLIVTGRVSGILGTDTYKRDIFTGIVAGLKWALFIGLATSVVSVLFGVMYGIISAYFGGLVDTSMQFVYQIFAGIPVMPLLIVLAAIFKPSIWIIMGVMIVFSWTGSVMTVRSMAFQIKEETFVEAAKALGSGKWRIIFKHIAPILLPYSFASMALAVPGTIVYEASLSLLGLGDPTIITWGQILHDAQNSGATLNGLWWWIVPPGLFIALMGATFAFLGFAMDKILNPKLRTR